MTEALCGDFRAAAKGLFAFTTPAREDYFEKGYYQHLVVKPVKRVAHLLATEREFLVLFTTFSDQQPRTIEMALDLIRRSAGRLERSIVIIVHKDPRGNEKLREWGRERSISAIPIFVDEAFPPADALEAIVLREFFAYDSFDVTGPVSDDAKFYGRRGEALELARHLRQGQVRAVLGLRKTGKTSILNRIIAELRELGDVTSIMIDCSRDSVWEMSEATLLAAISLAVENANANRSSYEVVPRVKGLVTISVANEKLTKALRASERRVVLFFDEVDYITPSSPTSEGWAKHFNPFWRNLRAVQQELSRSDVRLSIMVAGVSSKWFREETVMGIENAALSFIPEEYLSALDATASIQMIKSLGRTSGLNFTDGAADTVASCCGRVPFWIRKACSFIHRRIPTEGRPKSVDISDITEMLETFLEVEGAAIAGVAVGNLFRIYPELRSATESCVKGRPDQVRPGFRASCERYGLIRRDGSTFVPGGRMMELGIQSALGTTEQPDTHVSGSQYETLDQWAEDLALCNARRNKIERRLRGMVVNFIRSDVIRTKSASTTDRLLAAIDGGRRQSFFGLTPEEMIEKFYWSDLTQLIAREWSLFEPVFASKADFQQHSKTANERPDAHAKDVDKLNLALYRRSLDYFESQVNRV